MTQHYSFKVTFRDIKTNAVICWASFTSKSAAEIFHKQALLPAQHYTVTLEDY